MQLLDTNFTNARFGIFQAKGLIHTSPRQRLGIIATQLSPSAESAAHRFASEVRAWPDRRTMVHIAAMIPGRLPWAGMNQAFGLVDSIPAKRTRKSSGFRRRPETVSCAPEIRVSPSE